MIMYKITINQIDDTKKFAERFSKFLEKGDVISLSGDLGAGKTTFTQYLGKELGIHEDITSPTFNLVHCYEFDQGKFYHVDLYRLNSEEEIESLDMDSFLYPDGITVIEWAENASSYMPTNIIRCEIKSDGMKREFRLYSENMREKELTMRLEK